MYKKFNIRAEKLVLLSILFGFYVVGDLMTTVWLIDRYPGGISGEKNPFGVLIYASHGIFGLIFFKIIIFIIVSVWALILEYHYGGDRRSMMISDYSILGLMAWSIIAVTVNVMQVYLISLQEGTYESSFLLKLYLVIFSVTMAGIILLPKFVPSVLSLAEIFLIVLVILGPFVFSPGLYDFLIIKNSKNLVIYLVSNGGIIALMIYTMQRLYKHSTLRQM